MKHHDPQETTSDPHSLGERIKAVRRNWEWSQQELAQALKVDQASISFWERDLVKPGGAALVSLASLFRVSVDALVEGRDFRSPDAPSGSGSKPADRRLPRSVALPSGAGHPLTLVDLGDGSWKDGGLVQALISLDQGLKANRRAWVVLE